MIKLNWQIVCGRYELEELETYKAVELVEFKNNRHQLFHVIKHPNHNTYKGGWGPELMLYDKQDDLLRGQLGVVWATEARGQEIASWIRDQMFNLAPGND
jgi:hypothetical protein